MPDEEPMRRFGWSDMFVKPEEDPRTEGGFPDEKSSLVWYLRDNRLMLKRADDRDAGHAGHADLIRECIDGRVG